MKVRRAVMIPLIALACWLFGALPGAEVRAQHVLEGIRCKPIGEGRASSDAGSSQTNRSGS
jgi:hypothetical protein